MGLPYLDRDPRNPGLFSLFRPRRLPGRQVQRPTPAAGWNGVNGTLTPGTSHRDRKSVAWDCCRHNEMDLAGRLLHSRHGGLLQDIVGIWSRRWPEARDAVSVRRPRLSPHVTASQIFRAAMYDPSNLGSARWLYCWRLPLPASPAGGYLSGLGKRALYPVGVHKLRSFGEDRMRARAST